MLAALHLTDPRQDALRQLTEIDWRGALEFSDRARLTLVLREVARDAMPPWVRDRVDENAAKWLIRRRSIEDLYRTLYDLLTRDGLEFIALKGVTHTGIANRVQYDVDLYLPSATVGKAQQALVASGWTQAKGMDGFPTDHLPALIRRTDWQWRGDFFDPDLPLAVELHFRFWNDEVEHLRAPGTDEFWARRVSSRLAGVEMEVLSPPDLLAYAALHLLKHVLRGSVRGFPRLRGCPHPAGARQ